MTSVAAVTPGKLIVLEGPDGVGKSTIAAAIAAAMEAQGVPVKLLAFPGNQIGTLGRLVYKIHHTPAQFDVREITAAGKQALHIAAHLDAIEREIIPALQNGQHVVLDRFWWSTWVYGTVGGINPRILRRLIDVELAQWGSVYPALVILLRRKAPISRHYKVDYWQALCREYDRLASQEQGKYPQLVIGNELTLKETIAHVTDELSAKMLSDQTDDTRGRRNDARQLRLQMAVKVTDDGRSDQGLHVAPSIAPAQPSPLYDTYWRFAAERQRIFFERLEGLPPPWTDDPVLARHKFTNAYRASDRVSQYLIRQVIYGDDLPDSDDDTLFRIILFKIFNRIDTWELLERQIGTITYADYDFDAFDAVMTDALRNGRHIYSAAYIMPSGDRAFGEAMKHRNHLRLIERMMKNELPKRLADARSMQVAFDLLRSYPTIGDFLAYQFVTDINYSELTHFSEREFVALGPGARDGIRKCFTDLGGLNEPEIIRFMADRQSEEFSRLDLKFQSLWGRPLQFIDCQSLFCEVDKYTRVTDPNIRGLSGRTRIKQRFAPSSLPIDYWYPPKWGINEAASTVQRLRGQTEA
jgi:thymidylate kinase